MSAWSCGPDGATLSSRLPPGLAAKLGRKGTSAGYCSSKPRTRTDTAALQDDDADLVPAAAAPSSPRDEASAVSIVLTLAAVRNFLGTAEFGRLGRVSRVLYQRVLDDSEGDLLWRLLWTRAAQEFGLGPPNSCPPGRARRDFLKVVWPSRQKWDRCEAGDFRIQVAARFRPAPRSTTGILVPLHQRLRLLKAGEQLNEHDPQQYLCGLLGTPMHDPVRLPSSGAVVERATIETQIRVQPRDPFDRSPLAKHMLQPCAELRREIQAWKARKRDRLSRDSDHHKVQAEQVDELVGTVSGVQSAYLEALMEAAMVRRSAARACAEAADSLGDREWDGGDVAAAAAMAPPPAAAGAAHGEQGWFPEDRFVEMDGGDHSGGSGDERCSEERTAPREVARQKERARLLALRSNQVVMFQPGVGVRPFVFRRCFDGQRTQTDVYVTTGQDSVRNCLAGFNSTLLCYGQTGSGKTHTMFGPPGCLDAEDDWPSESSGIAMRALADLCWAAEVHRETGEINTQLALTYVQIYQDKITCLLSGSPATLRAGGAIQGATAVDIQTYADVLAVLREGEIRKEFAETAMNQRSSRAHTVLNVDVTQTLRRRGTVIRSRLCLVDLAGSERVKKSLASGCRLFEAIGINSSLTALGRTILALVEDRSHVPYYDSRLTCLLKPSLGGNARTQVLICCSGDEEQGDETLQSLGFGERCSMVTNRTLGCVESVADVLHEMDAALAQSRSQLRKLAARGKADLPAYRRLQERHEELKQRRRRLRACPDGSESEEDDGAEQAAA